MKKLSYIATLATALVFAGSSAAISGPCPVGQPCPSSASPCPCECNQAKPCPCQNAPSSSLSISDSINAQPCFKTFARLLEQADLSRILRGQGPYTVFAPTDAAFCKLPAGTVERLMCPQNKCELERLLRYHIVTEEVPCTTFNCPTKIRTSEGQCIVVQPDGSSLCINNCAKILQGDICTKSGRVYTIDTVLMPTKVSIK